MLETGLSVTEERSKLTFFSILVQFKDWACSSVYLKLLEKTTKSFWIKHSRNLLQLQEGACKKFTGDEYVKIAQKIIIVRKLIGAFRTQQT